MHVESRLNLSSKGFDIFNPNDPFYNGVCAPFDINNKDVLLSQRRKLFYKNLSLCNNNCEYKNICYDNYTINCECKGNIMSATIQSKQINKVNDDYINSSIDPININVIKCINLLSWNNIKANPSFWIGGAMTVGSIALCVVNMISSFSNLFSLVSSPLINNNSEEGVYFEEKTTINTMQSRTRTKSIDGNSKDNFIAHNNELIVETHIKEYFDTEIRQSFDFFPELSYESNYPQLSDINNKKVNPSWKRNKIDYIPFIQALKIDKRSFCSLLIKIFIKKVFILRTLFPQSPFEMKSLNISVYILYLISTFTFNALFFSNGMISNRYEGNNNNDIIKRAILSNVISVILYKLSFRLLSFYFLLETIMIEFKDKESKITMMKRALYQTKIKIILFYIVDISLIGLCWYYLTTFNIVYRYCRLNLF